jgi:hypothetical protein
MTRQNIPDIRDGGLTGVPDVILSSGYPGVPAQDNFDLFSRVAQQCLFPLDGFFGIIYQAGKNYQS